MIDNNYDNAMSVVDDRIVETGTATDLPFRPRRLEFRNVAGAGLQIHAEIDFEPKCVEFKMKKGLQPILEGNKNLHNLGYEPWIQFPANSWDEMLEQTFQEMIDLWNEKYSK